MPSGYGNDTTASGDDSSSSGGANYAAAIASIFQTGVTAYVDSQAIQRGYQINDPRYFQSGYPAGVSLPYGATPQGASVAVSASGNKWIGLALAAVVVYFLLKK